MGAKRQLRESPAECGRYISYIYRKSSSNFAMQLKQEDISSMQSIILVGVYRNEGINQQTLGKLISVDSGVISRTLRELEDKGYIEKKRDEQNRRNYNIYITTNGCAMAEKSLQIQEEYWCYLLQKFSQEEVDTLKKLLHTMEIRAYEDTDNLRTNTD